MNMPAIQSDNPLVQALVGVLGPLFTQNQQTIQAMGEKFCAALATNQTTATAVAVVDDHSHCKCGGACTDKSKCANGTCALPEMAGAGIIPMWQPRGGFNACYSDCTRMDKCLIPYMEAAYSRTDDWAWFAMWITDPLVIHMNKSVGAAPYINFPNAPLAASTKTLLAMEDAQNLPFRGGGIKVDPKWNGTPAPSEVKVRLFTGPRGLIGVTSTDGLVKMGGDLTLSDFECKDDCYILEFPKLLGCVRGPIPADLRSLYVELEASANVGGSTLTSINFTILKRGSDAYFKSCRQWGWNPELGCA